VSELPSWIDNWFDQNLDNALSQTHVVETMVDSARPFLRLVSYERSTNPM